MISVHRLAEKLGISEISKLSSPLYFLPAHSISLAYLSQNVEIRVEGRKEKAEATGGRRRGSAEEGQKIEEVEGPKPSTSQRELTLIRQQRARIEREIAEACEDVLKLLTSTLIPAAHPGDETVFYYKM